MRIRSVLLATSLAAAAFALPSAAAPRRADARHPRIAPGAAPTFNVSGEFTGSMAGDVLLGGASYRVAPGVRIYEIGLGLLPAGSMIGDRYVFLSGVRSGGVATVTSVIVRPASEAAPGHAPPPDGVRLKDPGAGE